MEIPIEIELQVRQMVREIQNQVEFMGMIYNGGMISDFTQAFESAWKAIQPGEKWTALRGANVKQDAILILEALFPNLKAPEQIWPEFWLTPLGKVLLQAILWADQDKLITLTQAAAISGRSLSHLSNYARGRLPHFYEPSDNPTHTIRLRKSDVLALPAKRITLDKNI